MKRSIILISCLVITYVANAVPEPFTGQIETISAGPGIGDKVMVRVVGYNNMDPYSTSCASGYWTYSFRPSIPGGKEAYSLLLTAYASRNPVIIYGLGTCSVHGNAQDLESVRFEQ